MAGFSVALGAFLAGMLAAESGRVRAIEHLAACPLRDLFTAVFFVSVGMLLVPEALWSQRFPILLLSLLVILGNALSSTTGGLLAGLPLRTSLRTGLALGQIGEFGYIILGTGIAAGVVRNELYTAIVAVGVVTTFLTPLLLRGVRPLGGRPSRPDSRRASAPPWGSTRPGRKPCEGRGSAAEKGRASAIPPCSCWWTPWPWWPWSCGHRWLMLRWTQWIEGRLHWGHSGGPDRWWPASWACWRPCWCWPSCARAGSWPWIWHCSRRIPAPAARGGGAGTCWRAASGWPWCSWWDCPCWPSSSPSRPEGVRSGSALAVFVLTLGAQWTRARRLTSDLVTGTEWLLAKVRDPWSNGGEPRRNPRERFAPCAWAPSAPAWGCTSRTWTCPAAQGSRWWPSCGMAANLVPLHPPPVLQEGDLLALAGPESALDEAENLLARAGPLLPDPESPAPGASFGKKAAEDHRECTGMRSTWTGLLPPGSGRRAGPVERVAEACSSAR